MLTKHFSKTLLLFSFFLLFYVIFKSEIIFNGEYREYYKSYFIFLETIPMTVKMQDDNDEATKSVGEKASPFPLLSAGASVTILLLEDTWIDSVLRFPK